MNARVLAADGGPCERAVCTGGAYRGLAIERNLFSFDAGPHEIVVEPPVSDGGQPSSRTIKNPDGTTSTVRGGHYFSGLRTTGVAEVVVPECLFDGTQHLRIIPCEVLPASQGDVPEKDSAAGMSGPEIENRRLVRLKFDLSGCEGCLLDKVGIAVYWESDPEGDAWKNGHGMLSVFSDITREAACRNGSTIAGRWAAANGGAFPSGTIDEVLLCLEKPDDFHESIARSSNFTRIWRMTSSCGIPSPASASARPARISSRTRSASRKASRSFKSMSNDVAWPSRVITTGECVFCARSMHSPRLPWTSSKVIVFRESHPLHGSEILVAVADMFFLSLSSPTILHDWWRKRKQSFDLGVAWKVTRHGRAFGGAR